MLARIAYCMAIIFTASNGQVFADTRLGAYFCKATAAGGVAFDTATKRWRGSTFQVNEDNFVIRVRDAGKTTKSFDGKVSRLYNISISSSKDSHTGECHRGAEKDLAHIELFRSIDCQVSFHNFRFNLDNKRYMETYNMGFVEGGDSGGDAPSITVGTCTKIPN